MAIFLRDVGNYVFLFFFIFALLSMVLGIVLMFVGVVIGMLIHLAFGIDNLTESASVLGGLAVGVSVGIISAFFISIWGTIKTAPTEANRKEFLRRTAQTLGRPDLASEMGYGEEDDEDDGGSRGGGPKDIGDWYTRARDRAMGEGEDYVPRR